MPILHLQLPYVTLDKCRLTTGGMQCFVTHLRSCGDSAWDLGVCTALTCRVKWYCLVYLLEHPSKVHAKGLYKTDKNSVGRNAKNLDPTWRAPSQQCGTTPMLVSNLYTTATTSKCTGFDYISWSWLCPDNFNVSNILVPE